MCDCFKIGGPWIAEDPEDPDCPVHGTERVKEDTRDVIDLHEKAIELLNHLEDVLDEENFKKINHNLWNEVSMFLVNREINGS